jgi:hypothetical protein
VALVVGEIQVVQHTHVAPEVVGNETTALVEQGLQSLEDIFVQLGAILWLDVLVFDAQVEELGVRTVWSVSIVHEGIVHQLQLLVHHRNPADALWDLAVDWGEHQALAVECKKLSWGDQVQPGGELLRTACVGGRRSAVASSTAAAATSITPAVAASATVVFDNFGHERRPAVDVDHVVGGNRVDRYLVVVIVIFWCMSSVLPVFEEESGVRGCISKRLEEGVRDSSDGGVLSVMV